MVTELLGIRTHLVGYSCRQGTRRGEDASVAMEGRTRNRIQVSLLTDKCFLLNHGDSGFPSLSFHLRKNVNLREFVDGQGSED